MEERNRQEYDPAALAEAILLDPARLPAAIREDLQTLRQMLEDAVAGEEDEPQKLSMPGYGKSAVPDGGGRAEGQLILRRDEALPCPEQMIDLSARRDGQYVTVPRVIHG